MSKVIVIERCKKCPCFITGRTYDWSRGGGTCLFDGVEPLDNGFPDNCPLPDLPERKRIEHPYAPDLFAPGELDIFVSGILDGFNRCLNEIKGEVED